MRFLANAFYFQVPKVALDKNISLLLETPQAYYQPWITYDVWSWLRHNQSEFITVHPVCYFQSPSNNVLQSPEILASFSWLDIL